MYEVGINKNEKMQVAVVSEDFVEIKTCILYTSPSPRD